MSEAVVTGSVETLAEALHALGGCKRCQRACENRWPCVSADRYRDDAAALASDWMKRHDAEVWDEGYECGRDDEVVGVPKLDANPYRAALAKEGGDRG